MRAVGHVRRLSFVLMVLSFLPACHRRCGRTNNGGLYGRKISTEHEVLVKGNTPMFWIRSCGWGSFMSPLDATALDER